MSQWIFKDARTASKNSTCVKTQTGAVIIKDGKTVSFGYNLCAPEGVKYGETVPECPRMKIKTGANYELCSPVHAEIMAALNIRKGREDEELGKFAGHLNFQTSEILGAFNVEELRILNGAELYLVGHYWACDNCVKFLAAVGIPKENIKFDPITGSETKARYAAGGITKGDKT